MALWRTCVIGATAEPVAPPTSAGRLTNQQILLGQKHDPIEIIKIYTADQWEQFIREWAEGLSARYKEVRRASGSGDRGRDIIGYAESVGASPWDNHQCKHYDHALYPSDMWKELAKLCYYTFEKKYSMPRAYCFVAPQGIGPDALLLLENPEKMRTGLIAKWKEGGLLKVGKHDIQLSGDLLSHVENFDFTIIKDVPPSKIIEDHRRTRYHAFRRWAGEVALRTRLRFPMKLRTMRSGMSNRSWRHTVTIWSSRSRRKPTWPLIRS